MKRVLKSLSAMALCLLLLLPMAACGGGGLPEENLVEDSYDNYYEIFPYSFCDSDGNGIGDLKGITEKLGYVRDLGYTGIWLTPINPTGSYHGYDVTDYKGINPKLGTMEDFEELLTAAHAKGIRVIIDLVVNHTSNNHPWFKAALAAARTGNTQDPHFDYYNFSTSPKTGYRPYGSVYAEAQFADSMPDLNLDSEGVRGELSDIIGFWMKKGVDGFRLDAVRYYYFGNAKESAEFTGWIKQEAVKHNPDAYIVGEDWSSVSEIEQFYESGADSFFCFPAQGADGYVNRVLSAAMHPVDPAPVQAADQYYNSMLSVTSMAKGHIPAPFLCNHDTARIAGVLMRDVTRIKFAYGLLSMYAGNTFTYYGDEIGMLGSANDPAKRVGMRWTDDTKAIYPPDADPKFNYYVFDSVETQLKDEDSILNYYKACNRARNAFPAIMRGEAERIPCETQGVLAVKKTYRDSSVTIVINFSSENVKVGGLSGELKQGICVSGSVSGSGSSLSMPRFSIAILA